MINFGNEKIEIHELIAVRRSPRAFSGQPVEPEILQALFEAARWAPSSFNEQPWRFIYAAKDMPEEYSTLLDILSERNRQWAHSAPVLLLSIAKDTFTRNEKPNRHAFHDVGLAMGNLTLQATASGLYVHQMAGFDREKARETLQIPEGYEAVAMAAIGYPAGDPGDLPEPLKSLENAPRTRKSLEEIVYAGKWENKPQ
jgi:nitroreductase